MFASFEGPVRFSHSKITIGLPTRNPNSLNLSPRPKLSTFPQNPQISPTPTRSAPPPVTMNLLLRRLSSSLPLLNRPPSAPEHPHRATAAMMQWARGIRVRVHDDNLEQALTVMQRKMQSSGMERLIKRHADNQRHLKNSEKRVLARKNLQMRIRSQELARKLQSILAKKIRGL